MKEIESLPKDLLHVNQSKPRNSSSCPSTDFNQNKAAGLGALGPQQGALKTVMPSAPDSTTYLGTSYVNIWCLDLVKFSS